jgi:hypothetical protein
MLPLLGLNVIFSDLNNHNLKNFTNSGITGLFKNNRFGQAVRFGPISEY